jgi:hypothetical protein
MKKIGPMIFLILLSLMAVTSSCKKSRETEAFFMLTVECSAGVTGEPQPGSFTYSESSSAIYNYSAATGYGDLRVTLDGSAVAASGSIPMNMDHTLSASAGRIAYFQGNWKLDVRWTSQTCSLENGSNLAAAATQNGDDITLSVSGMNAVAAGTIDLQGNFELTAEVIYPNQSKFKYAFSGKMNGENSFSGEVKANGYLNNSPVCTAVGKFSAARVS